MTDVTGTGAGLIAATQALPVWRECPTLLVEQVAAFANAGTIAKITFAEIAFNPAPGATMPIARPQITLAAQLDVWEAMAKQILEIVGQVRAASAANG